jgi:hypothetical protein
MPQIFHSSANTIARASIGALVLLVGGGGFTVFQIARSPYVTGAGIAHEQPVPFSHQHHVAGIGIDCRYCHTSVEVAASAGIPPTKTCMNCHSQIWSQSPTLEPVRESFRSDKSIEWRRIHDLPDYAYFNHSAHVNKGVGCTTCHGRVDQMPLMRQHATLQMEWCLDCHRKPEKYVRPKEEVFNVAWEPPPDQLEKGRALVKEYGIQTRTSCGIQTRTSCNTCHR